MTNSKTTLGAIAAAALLTGCGSQVIPGAVLEGTTATIAIPFDFDVGYGRAWAGNFDDSPPSYNSTNVLEDLQRGELIFRLYEVGQSGPGTKLAVRYITRVSRDPSSSWSYNTGNHSQPIAFVDIPYGLTQDAEVLGHQYQIEVRRWRRNASHTFVEVPQSYWEDLSVNWWGWGSQDGGPGSQSQRIPITVMDSPLDNPALPNPPTNYYTPIEAWGPYGTRNLAGGQIRKGIITQTVLDTSIPLPEFRVRIPGSNPTAPAAWEMTIQYPSERMQVFDVRLLRENPSGGIAGWKASAVAPSSGCATPGGVPGTLTLHVADPYSGGAVPGVAVAFQLANQSEPNCQKRVVFDDVDIVPDSYRAYDLNGNLLTGTNPFQVVSEDLY